MDEHDYIFDKEVWFDISRGMNVSSYFLECVRCDHFLRNQDIIEYILGLEKELGKECSRIHDLEYG